MVYFVATPKVKMINVRLKPSVHDEFKIACELRGASMSSLMHQFIVRTIREEKDREPQAFRRNEIEATKGQRVAHVQNGGELSNETAQRMKKKAGRK